MAEEVNPFTVSESTDEVPIRSEVLTATPDDDSPFRCEVCGTALVYGGRGRHPKYCDEHKPNKTSNSTRSGSSDTAQLNLIRESLTELYVAAGLAVGWVNTTDGMVIADKASMLADSWVELAKNDPKVKKALLRLTKSSGWGGVIVAHGMVALAIAGNHDVNPLELIMGKKSSE